MRDGTTASRAEVADHAICAKPTTVWRRSTWFLSSFDDGMGWAWSEMTRRLLGLSDLVRSLMAEEEEGESRREGRKGEKERERQ